MKSVFAVIVSAGLLMSLHAGEKKGIAIDAPAPDFTAADIQGNRHTLSAHRGKVVVLEWVNLDCPFVKKFYDVGAMQKLQSDYVAKGVVWYSINSSAAGKQGHFEPKVITERLAKHKAAPTAYLVDAQGEVGRLYGARTTPHMFVIDTAGVLVYAGAIDDKPSPNSADIKGAKNYVSAALDLLLDGKPVAVKVTQPYGCSVKY